MVGTILLAGALLALVVGQGGLGATDARQTVVDPAAAHAISGHPLRVLIASILVGLLLLILGLTWFARSVRPQRRPDLLLDADPDSRLVLTSGGISEAVRADCVGVGGVTRARVRTVGSTERPAMRVNLWLEEGTDLREVWSELESGVLARLRQSLGDKRLPVGIRVEMDAEPRLRAQ
jgi:hypothetical protein